MRAHFDRLVLDNPMRIEIARFRRRFLGFGGNGVTSAVLSLVMLCYAGLILLVINTRGDLPPVALVMFQTVLFLFFGPMMLHGAIAGERERRSWDMLLVAPITKGQIVAGKFLGAMTALGVGAAAMAVPTAIAAVSYHNAYVNTRYLSADAPLATTSYWDLALAEGVSLTFCMLVCAVTIFLSARAKRPLMALGTTLGSLVVALLVAPALFVSLSHGDQFSNELFLYLNPFYPLAVMLDTHQNVGFGASPMISLHLQGLPQIFVYLALTVGFLVYAEKTLSFPDNEVRFMPQGSSNA